MLAKNAPIAEADVRLHVARQTERAIGLIDLVAMKRGAGIQRFEAELRQGRSIVALDVVDDETLQWVGGLIWNTRGQGIFAIGSQGVEYALVAHWRATGVLPAVADYEPASQQSQIVGVSGSISAVTAAQIKWAEANGFELSSRAPQIDDDRSWKPLPDADAFGRLCSLRARLALDGVSWVQLG